jgi:hypothetical protein
MLATLLRVAAMMMTHCGVPAAAARCIRMNMIGGAPDVEGEMAGAGGRNEIMRLTERKKKARQSLTYMPLKEIKNHFLH